jgi:capsular polysaccharide biosynthesis protein
VDNEVLEISFQELLQIIRKNLVIIIAVAFTVCFASFFVSQFIIPKTYDSTVKFYVSTTKEGPSASSAQDMSDLTYAQKVVNTYIEMLQTSSFEKQVLDASNVENYVDISFATLNNTEVFQAKISTHDAYESKQVADVLADIAPDVINTLEASATLKVVDPASVASSPSSPNVLLNTIIGLLVGLMLAIGFVFIQEHLDVRIKNEDIIGQKFDLPVLASIPAFNKEYTKKKKKAKKGK